MNLIVLAAGLGSRLGTLGIGRPKCLVTVAGVSILDHLNAALVGFDFDSKTMVVGHHSDQLQNRGFHLIKNPEFDRTTMIDSLWLSRSLMAADFMIVYGDLILPKSLIEMMVSATDGISVAVDPNWTEAWSERYEDPLDDAECLRIEGDRITQIGQRAKTLSDVDAHYMGVITVAGPIRSVFTRYLAEHRAGCPSLTDFLSELLTVGVWLKPVYCTEPWAEIDTVPDHAYATKLFGEIL